MALSFGMRSIVAVFALTAASVASHAAAISIQIVASHGDAQAGNESPAYLLVQLANPDGSPRVDLVLPKPKIGDPTSGLELKGTKWSFETMTVPAGYQAQGVQVLRPQTYFEPAVSRPVTIPGQLRLMQVAPAFQTNNPTDPHRGLYYFTILPMVGFQGQQKQFLRWIAGQYVFRMFYRDGQDLGTAIASLQIP